MKRSTATDRPASGRTAKTGCWINTSEYRYVMRRPRASLFRPGNNRQRRLRSAETSRLTLAAALLALWLCPATGVLAGIVNTLHNLTGLESASFTDKDSEAVCVFCHTPQGNSESVPQWIGSDPATKTGYRTYDSFGYAREPGIDSAGSVSLSCLSCHDGTQAHNIAGHGYVASGDIYSTPPEDTLTYEPISKRLGKRICESDKSGNHPVGIPYRGAANESQAGDVGTAVNPYVSENPAAAHPPLTGYKPTQSAIIDQVQVWWLETGEPGRQRSDVHLYTRYGANNQPAPYIECSTCHDPHAENRMFLRTAGLSGTREPLCMACHDI